MLKYISREKQPDRPCPTGISEFMWRLLWSRGVSSAEEAQAFLHPEPRHLLNPFDLSGMEDAVRRIRRAARQEEKVWIWGDYDVDGVCASAILFLCFEKMGISKAVYLPSRHTEGYGLNASGLEKIAQQGGGLLVTVDCGVSSADLVKYAQSLGLDVIVTDHHRPPEVLPECAVVHPLLGEYANPNLCGAGVAFKLAQALLPEEGLTFLDLAALATIADVVPLTKENRTIVSLGLDRINAHPRPGIRALADVSGISGVIRAGNVGFQLGPRLNAGGRMDSAQASFDLLTVQNPDEAVPLALHLENENTLRRSVEASIMKEAEAQLEDIDLSTACVIVLAGNWNVGVVGLTAGRLTEKYHLPTILLSASEDTLTGSCRSIPGVDIYDALTQVSDLLIRFGGHKQAAGLTLFKENFDAFRTRLNRVIAQSADPNVFIPTAEYDARISLSAVQPDLISMLDRMQPCGFGNPTPVLLTEGQMVRAKGVGSDSTHLSFALSDGDRSMNGIFFSQGRRAADLSGENIRLLFSPGLNTYRNRVSVQLEAKAAEKVSSSRLLLSEEKEQSLLHDFLTQSLYNEVFPSGTTDPDEAIAGEMILSPRGHLAIALDNASATRLLTVLERMNVPAPDVFTGAYPEDKRCWNALCVLPTGKIPSGYRKIWCVGGPSWLTGRDVRQGMGVAKWLSSLPDTDRLREIYLAAKKALSVPLSGKTVRLLPNLLGARTNLPPASVFAGMLTLRELELISFSENAASLCPVRKVSPEKSSLFQKLALLRRWEGDQNDTTGTVL